MISIKAVIHKYSVPFIRENGKLIARFIFTSLFIGLGIWFLKHEQTELHEVKNVLTSSRLIWISIGLAVTVLYIIMQGFMYVASFASVRSKIALSDAIILFLKRNFISIFLPAGGMSSLAFFSKNIERQGITKSQIYFASTIYGFVGIVSVVVVAIPAFIYAFFQSSVGKGEWYALAAIIILTITLFLIYHSVIKKGIIFRWLVKISPSAEIFIDDLQTNKIERKYFLTTIAISTVIEFVGITHVYIAIKALQFSPSLLAAVMGYIVAVIFLVVSPFLRGLGAIEISMVYVLTRFGYTNVESIAITFLYRFFEFWLPLLAGAVSFLLKINKILMRVVPAILLLSLGIVNIISVITPAIAERLDYLKNFLLIDVIDASNFFVMIAGLFLLVTAAFMLKGLRSAWWFALGLSVISFVGHITKAIDYEEATVALLVIVVLLFTRKEYYIRNNLKLRYIGIQTSILSLLAVMAYGIIGFYFLDKKHFNIDFNWLQSIEYTVRNFFLIGNGNLAPADAFAHNFLYSINISGFVSIAFVLYTLIRPYVGKSATTADELARANNLIKNYGTSGMDYFKTYADKNIFLPESAEAFIAYKVAGNFAVVLENPVSKDSGQMEQCITRFDRYCYESGLKSIYYRVPEESLPMYKNLGKRSLFLGQEAIVDLAQFTLEGGNRKSMRNAINKITEKGYKASVHIPPVKDGILQKVKSVSDEWLSDTGRTEIIFSQGMFLWDELKQQTIITVENAEEKIIAFLNIIPDYAKGEGTYDLLRKTPDAPNGVMDFILVELFNHLKSQGFISVNLGFAPMSGINDAHTFPEKSMKFAYEKISSFAHYKGMRDYKEKFFPTWQNKYLIYDNDYDLLQVPGILAKVIKP
jgi:phosphatidylglycerol lysyltransferase